MGTTTSINGKEIFDLLRDDIAAIEEQFGRDTVSNVAAITEIGEYLRAGTNYMSVSFKWRSAHELADKLEQFAREAMPAFR